MKRLLTILVALLITISVTHCQIIYTFEPKTPIYENDLLLGSDSVTLNTANFRVIDLAVKMNQLTGKDSLIKLTKDYLWIGGIGDSLSTALSNLATYTTTLHTDQDIVGLKNFTSFTEFGSGIEVTGSSQFLSDVTFDAPVYIDGGIDIRRATSPELLFSGSGDHILLAADLTGGTMTLTPSVGTGGKLLHQGNVSEGANITIANTATGISISATSSISTDEDAVSILNTYSNLSISPGQFQDDVNASVNTVAGTVSTNTTDIGTLNTNKADKSNVLELDNVAVFTPDADYEPATKKYVDDNTIPGLGVYWTARVNDTGTIAYQDGAAGITVANTGTGLYTITHNFANTDYTSSGFIISVTSARIYVTSLGALNMQVATRNDSDALEDNDFMITIYK